MGLLLLVALGDAPVSARGNRHECKPTGQPAPLEFQGEALQPLDYLGETRMLAADRTSKLGNFRLISSRGDAIEIGKMPWTVEPARWLSRGHALYAVGSGRSQTEKKTDVVLVRWGTDSRPRLTKIATANAIAAPPRAVLINEHLAVVWAEPDATGKAHVKASFIDIEELRIREPQDLGTYADDGWLELAAVDQGFVTVWASQQGVMRARFDVHGKRDAADGKLVWKGATAVRGALACGDRVWLVHDVAANQVAVSASNATGELVEVTRLSASPSEGRLPMLCADDAAVAVAHRTVDAKHSNVIFWISTIDAAGKARGRRVRDMQGTADDIRLMQLVAADAGQSAWWVEGKGPITKVWSRPIVCETL